MAKKPITGTPEQQEDAARLLSIFKEWKERTGGSQEQLGAEAKIGTQGMVWQYLNSRTPLNLEVAVKFASAFNCKIEDFSPQLAASVLYAVELAAHKSPMVAQDYFEEQLLTYYRDVKDQDRKDAIVGAAGRIYNEEHPGTHKNSPFKRAPSVIEPPKEAKVSRHPKGRQ